MIHLMSNHVSEKIGHNKPKFNLMKNNARIKKNYEKISMQLTTIEQQQKTQMIEWKKTINKRIRRFRIRKIEQMKRVKQSECNFVWAH